MKKIFGPLVVLALFCVALIFTTGHCVGGVVKIYHTQPAPTVTETVEEAAPTVDNYTEVMEEPTQVVDNPVNDVHNSAGAGAHVESEYTDEHLEILALIIYQEAGADYCSDDTRRKVGSVFLNRVNSPSFPDTFLGVATQKRQYGELYWTGLKWPARASNSSEAEAVARAYLTAKELLIHGSVLPANVIWQAEFKQGDGVHSYQDGIYFCYSEVN
jgi:hypothetical protein